MRKEIAFLRRGREVRLGDIAPTLTLLDYLRLTEHAVGTKEGCAEGDCGACTVVLRKTVNGRLVYQPVNACILLAGQADGAEVITVEDLADRCRAAPGAAADRAAARIAVRLLHTRIRHGAVCALSRGAHRSARAWHGERLDSPATCAAAPATGRSSMPRCRRAAVLRPTGFAAHDNDAMGR
jgi:xanthine dehydrogenase iron-sulfur cluster and FAD-binding subunit A